MNTVHSELKLFCPCSDCPFYQKADNAIQKWGTYSVKSEKNRRQMFWCAGGKHKFSETSFSPLWQKHGSFKEYSQTAKLKCYGLSTPQIADVLEKDERTIEVWVEALALKSRSFHVWVCCYLTIIIRFLQLDELWSYVGQKSRLLWVFTALDVPTRFWLWFVTGQRTTANAKRLVGFVYLIGQWSRHQLLRIT